MYNGGGKRDKEQEYPIKVKSKVVLVGMDGYGFLLYCLELTPNPLTLLPHFISQIL